jgi:hypothetical protein
MATRDASSRLTLLEQAKRKDPDGDTAIIAEVLAETNEIIQDAPLAEANNQYGHKVVRRASLPSGTWRVMNDGVGVEASQTDEYTESIGQLESYSVIDKALYDGDPNPEAFRNSEIMAFLEGMSQTLATTFIYGDATVNTERFTGLAPRLNATTLSNVYSAGGTGSTNTSIFIVQWGLSKVFAIHPRGHSKLGVTRKDLGEKTWPGQTSGTTYQAMVDHFKFSLGFAVKDPRCIARICNIDISTVATAATWENTVIQALNEMPQRGHGATLYCNSDVYTMLDIYAKDKTNVRYGHKDAFGKDVMTFKGHPIKLVDAILSTEGKVS